MHLPIASIDPARRASAATPEVRRGQVLELEIEDLAFGGRALSRVNGLVVFVENALPGDRVVATVYRKKRQVEECLAHLGRVRVAARPVIPASGQYHYRNKMEYSFGRDAEGRLTLGLHRRGFFDRPFDLDRCHIATPISSEIAAHVREAARREKLPPYDTRRHEGLLRFLMVREGVRTGQVMVNLVATESHPAFEPMAADLRRAFPAVSSVLLNLTRRKAQVAIGDEEHAL